MSMRMEMGQYQKLQQAQILAPRMIQSMEILQLPLMSLLDRLKMELHDNPVLELREPGDVPGIDADFQGTESLEPEKPHDLERDELVIDPKHGELDFERVDALSRDYSDFLNEEHRPSRGSLAEEGDRKHDAMQNMADRPKTLQEHLEEQVPFLEASPEMEHLVRHVISYVDRTGYVGLRTVRKKTRKHTEDEDEGEEKHRSDEEVFVPVTLEEIATAYDRPVTVEQVEEALRLVQKFDPPGVGARDLRECLLLQVNDDMPLAEVVRGLIEHHLEDIQHNRLPVIQQRMKIDLEHIKEGIEQLRHLNPRPGAPFEPDRNRYVMPDIEITPREDGSGYDIKLLDDWVPEVYISKRYVEMSRDRHADSKTREFLKRKIQDAIWLKESIEQRRQTLEKVTRAIIDHQKAFLDKGPEHIQPLKMQQIADQVGVHVTTVSRAVDDKYVETPRGVFPLKRFFGGGRTSATGEDVAWERVKQILLEMIQNEDKRNPLSDEEIVEQFKEKGLTVARRTVTKYRKMLDIPSSRQRKDWQLIESDGQAAHTEPATPAAAPPEPGAETVATEGTAERDTAVVEPVPHSNGVVHQGATE